MRTPRLLSVLILLSMVAACSGGDGNGNPAAPTPQIPNVVGNYSGQTLMAFPELGQQISCPTTTTITQSGTTVNVAPFVLGGACGNISIPAGQMTIDNTGSLIGQSTVSYTDTTCGGRYTATSSGGFFGREFRLSINAVSSTCYNLNLTITVAR